MFDSISASKQDYLEAILDFTAANGQARSVDIARALGVSRASVNKSLGALIESGLVEHEHYGDVRLTQAGLKFAKQVRARHDSLKLFLTDILGVSEASAETDACKMEHTISRETAEKLDAWLKKLSTTKQ